MWAVLFDGVVSRGPPDAGIGKLRGLKTFNDARSPRRTETPGRVLAIVDTEGYSQSRRSGRPLGGQKLEAVPLFEKKGSGLAILPTHQRNRG